MQPIYKQKIYEVVQQKGSSVVQHVQRGKSNLMRDTSKLKSVSPICSYLNRSNYDDTDDDECDNYNTMPDLKNKSLTIKDSDQV